MDKKYLLSVLLILVLASALGYLTHGWALMGEYEATNLFRTPEEQEARMLFMMLAHVIFAAAFVALYRKGVEAKPWLGQGIRFGLLVALIAYVPIYMIYYVVQPMPEMLAFRQAMYETINTMILGAAVAWMYR